MSHPAAAGLVKSPTGRGKIKGRPVAFERAKYPETVIPAPAGVRKIPDTVKLSRGKSAWIPPSAGIRKANRRYQL